MNSKSGIQPVQRRSFLKILGLGWLGMGGIWSHGAYAKIYLSPDQAKRALCGDQTLTEQPVLLTRAQAKSIAKASQVRVRKLQMHTWRCEDGSWFILDQVIGKHENIDMAVVIDSTGKVNGIEVLEYRESYGHQIINPRWLAQFYGRDSHEVLKLDKQIKNISGATLSCRHVTDGINRLAHTWQQVLVHL